jgi:hypothetical protein
LTGDLAKAEFLKQAQRSAPFDVYLGLVKKKETGWICYCFHTCMEADKAQSTGATDADEYYGKHDYFDVTESEHYIKWWLTPDDQKAPLGRIKVVPENELVSTSFSAKILGKSRAF